MALLEWYNLIFVAPVGLAGFYLILSAVGLGGEAHGDAHLDHDVAVEHDVHFDHDVHLDHDAAVEHDVAVDHDVAVEHDVGADVGHAAPHGVEHEVHDTHVAAHHDSLALRALSVLGFGKAPVSVLMTCLLVLFGATGLIANGIFEHLLPWGWGPTIYVWPSLALAVLMSLTLTGSLARGLYRIMPTKETYAVTEEELVGQVGVSVYGIREGGRGPVNVKDDSGTVHQVSGHGADGDLPKGTEVILVRYHREGDYYDVTASPLGAGAGGAAGRVRTASGAGAEDATARGHGQRSSAARDTDVLTR